MINYIITNEYILWIIYIQLIIKVHRYFIFKYIFDEGVIYKPPLGYDLKKGNIII